MYSGLAADVKSVKLVSWPLKIEELEEEDELSPIVVKLLSAFQGWKNADLSPSTLSLASVLTQYITTRPTTSAINATITLHDS